MTALSVQHGVAEEAWPHGSRVWLRAALHSGETEARSGTYTGSVPVRVGRLRNHAPPGRTVVSTATAELVRHQLPEGVSLVALERDGTGAMVFGLLGPDDPPFETFAPAADEPVMPPGSQSLPRQPTSLGTGA